MHQNNQNWVKKLSLMGFVIGLFTLISCQPHAGDGASSNLMGSTISDLNKSGKSSLKPRYELLAQDTLKIAIFYTLNDKSGNTAVTDDLAYQEMANLQSWITGYGQTTAFLQNAAVTQISSPDGTVAYQVTGQGPKLGSSTELMPYQFTLCVGKAELIATFFGQSMATNQIAMLNGHFYSQDPGTSHPTYDAEASINRIYAPAMAAFTQATAGQNPMYRIVLFNNCYSEQLENLVLSTVQANGQTPFDMLSQRGISNYYDFSAQITSLLLDMANLGAWTNIMQGLKTTSPRSSQITPIFRQIATAIPTTSTATTATASQIEGPAATSTATTATASPVEGPAATSAATTATASPVEGPAATSATSATTTPTDSTTTVISDTSTSPAN